MRRMSLEEAASRLGELVAAARHGEPTVLTAGGVSVAVVDRPPEDAEVDRAGPGFLEQLMNFPGFQEEGVPRHDTLGGPIGAPALDLDPGPPGSERRLWSLLARFPGLIDESETDPFARVERW